MHRYNATSTRALSAASMLVLSALSATNAAISIDFTAYARNATLHDDVDMHWTIDSDLGTIRVALHAKAATGWAAFGFSEMGGMEGADLLYYEAETETLTDAHSLVAGTPVTDECTQDWTLVSAEVDATDGLVFVADRALTNSDPQDHDFEDDSFETADPTKILAAWGDDVTINYHGSDNVAQAQEYLFASVEDSGTDPLEEVKADSTASYFDVRAGNFTIPKIRTFYKDSCFPVSDLPAGGEFHVIGFDGELQDETASYVHHVVLKGFYGTDDCGGVCFGDTTYSSSSIDIASSSSSSGSSSPECANYSYADVYTWAPGAPAIATPDDVGFRFGASQGFQSIGVNIHYDNPDGIEGMVDDSGVRVYYTEELRPIDAGLMELGDPFVLMEYNGPLPDGKSKYTFSCPSSCTETYFEQEEVTVFARGLHMHQAGQRQITRQYRDDELIGTAEVEYYSFEQAGAFIAQTDDNATVRIGDRFETECYYDTAFAETDALVNGTLEWGLGSENEMCIDYIYYYPLQPIPYSGACGYEVCGGALEEEIALDIDSDLGRTFGILDGSCEELSDSSATDDDAATEVEDSGTSSSTLTAVPPTLASTIFVSSVAAMLAVKTALFNA